MSWPELAVFAAVAAHCYGMIVSQKLVRDENRSAALTNGVRMFGGGVLALITSYMVERGATVTNIESFMGWLALLILISNIICHNFYLRLLKRYTVTFVYRFFEPFIHRFLWVVIFKRNHYVALFFIGRDSFFWSLFILSR